MLSVVGLIPAHAGKTTPQSTGWPDPRAHPRSRGENGFIQVASLAHEGSSPLTRGKPGENVGLARRDRLIPAHAGKTCSLFGPFMFGWAHPRSRGENNLVTMPANGGDGSSPLTRGKPVR